jgi:hypothetical protein
MLETLSGQSPCQNHGEDLVLSSLEKDYGRHNTHANKRWMPEVWESGYLRFRTLSSRHGHQLRKVRVYRSLGEILQREQRVEDRDFRALFVVLGRGDCAGRN